MASRIARSLGAAAAALLLGVGVAQATQAAPEAPLRAVNRPAMAPGTELRYVAVTPCRIIDTRVGGGQLNGYRNFRSRDPLGAQGGNGSGCQIPSHARALALNMGAIGSDSGYLKAWAYGTSEPHASVVNYPKSQPGSS